MSNPHEWHIASEVIPMTPHPAFASTRRPLDPRKANIGLDANALNRNGTDQDRLVERFCQLVHDRVLRIVVAGGVRNEIQNPKTPAHKKAAVLPRIFRSASKRAGFPTPVPVCTENTP